MSGRIPSEPRRVLDQGLLCYVAVGTRTGPHLTPLVYVLDGGRLWVTTSRRSVKARAWRRDPTVAGLVQVGSEAVTFRGLARTYDALDPLSWPAAALAGPRLAFAATRFTLKNARFFAGYAADARRVPLAWTPPGRVFVAIEPVAGRMIDVRDGEVLEGWGNWSRAASYRSSFAPLARARGVDLQVPPDVRKATARPTSSALAVQGGGVLTTLPVRWRRVGTEGAYDVVLPRTSWELSTARPTTPAALAIDHASAWRAAEMAGVLLRGEGEAFAPSETRRGGRVLRQRIARALTPQQGGPEVEERALVRLRPARAVWWQGWTSGTVARPR